MKIRIWISPARGWIEFRDFIIINRKNLSCANRHNTKQNETKRKNAVNQNENKNKKKTTVNTKQNRRSKNETETKQNNEGWQSRLYGYNDWCWKCY